MLELNSSCFHLPNTEITGVFPHSAQNVLSSQSSESSGKLRWWLSSEVLVGIHKGSCLDPRTHIKEPVIKDAIPGKVKTGSLGLADSQSRRTSEFQVQ